LVPTGTRRSISVGARLYIILNAACLAVLEKMGARDRTQATIFALQRGPVHLD
jgi:hypothetical protein